MTEPAQAAERALACLDLTDLSAECDDDALHRLCDRATTPHGPVAAICIWPRFVAPARRRLADGLVRLATVVNFPAGTDPLEATLAETAAALADGADEIDMVVPHRALAAGDTGAVETRVAAVKELAGGATVKAILETGALGSAELIRAAAESTIAGGADFIKTSTGKVPVNAMPEAAREMLAVIARTGGRTGFKPSGGIKTTEDAARYLALCEEYLGPDWATPQTFRIDASSVLDELLATLDGAASVHDG